MTDLRKATDHLVTALVGVKGAPGTWGTLAAIPIVQLLSIFGPLVYMGATLVLLPLSVILVSYYESKTTGHDRPEIVIDEVLGFIITMTWLPMTWQALLIGFVLFRVLDITKPYPIGYLDKKVQGGLGVIADDVAAGIIANLIMQGLFTYTTWLGVQNVVIK